MLKIPGDGVTYKAVGWATFVKWRTRTAFAFAILAVALAVGVYFNGQHDKQQLKNQINAVVVSSCVASTKPGSTINNYNDLVQSIVDSRKEALAQHRLLPKNPLNNLAITNDVKALARYNKLFIRVPTLEECHKPILK